MNGVTIWAKANWKYVAIGLVLIICLASAVFTGINSRDIGRKFQTFTSDLADIGKKVSATGIIIGELKTESSGIAIAVGKWEERDKQLTNIARAIEANARRSEEQYRGITAGVTKIQAGLAGIERNVKDLGSNLNQLGSSMDSSLELVREGLSILANPTSTTPKTIR